MYWGESVSIFFGIIWYGLGIKILERTMDRESKNDEGGRINNLCC